MERLTKRNGDNVAYWNGANRKSFSDNQGNIYGEAITKLAEYEDAEEQGLLLRLPVPIGTEVHVISKCFAPNCEKCIAIGWNEHCFPEFHGKIYTHPMTYGDIPKLGKKVFLIKAEAEKALAEMG